MKINEPGRQKEERMKSLAAGVVCKAIFLVYSRFEKRVDLTALDLLQRGLYIFPLWCSIAGGRGEREREKERERSLIGRHGPCVLTYREAAFGVSTE